VPAEERKLADGTQFTVSESHPVNRRTGSYDAGGPFYTSRVTPFYKPGRVDGAYAEGVGYYSGPTVIKLPSSAEMTSVGYKNVGRAFGAKNEAQMSTDGTNAISYSNPVNPASNLATGLAEIIREKRVPSIPGIQLWKNKVHALKALGGEYLNYQFGWAPLHQEIIDTANAARHHRDIMKQYQHGEGRNTHRRFDYPLQRSIGSYDPEAGAYPNSEYLYSGFYFGSKIPGRRISLVRETKRWFEGCFTYALPSSTDSWRRALGFGSQADELFGFALSPDILWELTPWSWAVDWFSNSGEVINNVTNFGLAGLVLRYGYMMEESIESVTAEQGTFNFHDKKGNVVPSGPSSAGYESVTKRRVPASPFGFSIGWEGLSPTQLAITAALGITRVL
jgi:hypothetical protein